MVKNPPATAGHAEEAGSVPGLGRCPGVMATHCSMFAGNPMDRGTWQATVHGVTKSQTWLSN